MNTNTTLPGSTALPLPAATSTTSSNSTTTTPNKLWNTETLAYNVIHTTDPHGNHYFSPPEL